MKQKSPPKKNGVNCLIVSPKKQLANWKIFYIFGGGFVSGSAYEDLTIAAPISSITGTEIIIPEYRLAPEHPGRLLAMIRWLFILNYQKIVQPYLVSQQVAILLSLACSRQKKGLKLPVAAALISPWCNLTNIGDSMIFNDGRDPTLSLRQSNVAAGLRLRPKPN